MVLLPIVGHSLQARFSGPYTIAEKVGDVDYVVNTPDRQKKRRACHVNMLKPYIRRDDESKSQPVLSAVECDSKCEVEKEVCKLERENPCVKLKNSEVLAHIDDKLTHLSVKERSDVKELLSEYPQLFADVPS